MKHNRSLSKHLASAVVLALCAMLSGVAYAGSPTSPCQVYNSPYTPPNCPTVYQPWTMSGGWTGDNCGPSSPSQPYLPSATFWIQESATDGGGSGWTTVPGTTYSCCPTCVSGPPVPSVYNSTCTAAPYLPVNLTITCAVSGTATVGGTVSLGNTETATSDGGSTSDTATLAVTGSAAGTLSGTVSQVFSINSSQMSPTDMIPLPASCTDGTDDYTVSTQLQTHYCNINLVAKAQICQGWIQDPSPFQRAGCAPYTPYLPVPGKTITSPVSYGATAQICELNFTQTICTP